MRKRINPQIMSDGAQTEHHWLDLGRLAQVEISSEDEANPVEGALVQGAGSGWRAALPGEQALRLLFDEPLKLKRISLLFREEEFGRTQEFVLRWSLDGGRSFREVVRQQYNFSPGGATRESEEYEVELDGVTALELVITPDVSGGDARASLAHLRLA